LLNSEYQKNLAKMKKISIQRRISTRKKNYSDLGDALYNSQSFFAVQTSPGSCDSLIELKADYYWRKKKWEIKISEVYSESTTIVGF
jgi:hypothetical protein